LTDLLADALALAELGLLVFPVRTGAKSPALAGWQERASSAPDVVERLFGQYPGCNLGVATGERSGAFVLDVDTKSADGWLSLFELEAKGCELPPTACTETPSGGAHYWFRWVSGLAIRNRAGFLPGLDIRGEGGLVVAPPSVTDVGVYGWRVAPWDQAIADAPDWLIDLALAPVASGRGWPRVGLPPSSSRASAETVTDEFSRQVDRVESAAPGTRNVTLFQAAADLGELVGAVVLRRGYVDVALEIAAEQCGLVGDDGLDSVRATIDSGLKRGMANPRGFAP